MIVAETLARLKALDPQPFRLFGGALELAAVQQQPAATPAVYVFVESDAAGENEMMAGSVRQRVEADLAVVVVARNVADAAGGALALDIDALKRAVIDALLGWQPPSGDDVLTYLGSEIVRGRSGFAALQITFSAPSYLEVRA